MKKRKLLVLSVLSLLALTGCSLIFNSSSTSSKGDTVSEEVTSDEETTSTETSVDGASYHEDISISEPEEIEVSETTEDFAISSEDGIYTDSDGVYKITSAGTYSLSGKLEGQILVEAGEDDEVIIELNGASLSYDVDSPIKVISADKVEISAKSGTENTISDLRNAKVAENENLGEGAIYAKSDLKLKGSGTLVVTGNYNNGVHTSKDLSIQKLSLKVTGYNNALKGNNSVTINSGNIQAYAKTGNAIKTEDSDVSSKGNQKGTVTINGGTVYLDSLHDAIDASYNVEIDQLDSEVETNVIIKTGTNSSYYSKSTFKADSEKGLKAENDIVINNGTVSISASDDAIHANYGTTLGNNSKGTGNITVNGGTVQVISGDDGLHADNTLSITGGQIIVTNATEGFEANYINISGGYSYIYGTDDGVNCSKKSFSNCAFTMTGGYLDVAVSSGDTDGIDSNGNFTLSGGVIVTRGGPGNGGGMSTGLDVDGTCSMSGGTLISFNGLEKSPSTSSGVKYAGTKSSGSQGGPGGGHGGGFGPGGGNSSSSTSLQAGNYCLSGDGINITFINDYSYGSFLIYSSSLVTNSTYTLVRENSTILSWSQTSNSVTIS